MKRQIVDTRVYGRDLAIAQIKGGDQIQIRCRCGYASSGAYGLWPAAWRTTPLRQLAEQGRFLCGMCKRRDVESIEVTGFYGTGSQMCYRFSWPDWERVGTHAR